MDTPINLPQLNLPEITASETDSNTTADINMALLRNLLVQLKRHRECAGLTLQDVATKIGTTPDKIEALENGTADTTITDLQFYLIATRLVVVPKVLTLNQALFKE